jgi:hypothetical protein
MTDTGSVPGRRSCGRWSGPRAARQAVQRRARWSPRAVCRVAHVAPASMALRERGLAASHGVRCRPYAPVLAPYMQVSEEPARAHIPRARGARCLLLRVPSPARAPGWRSQLLAGRHWSDGPSDGRSEGSPPGGTTGTRACHRSLSPLVGSRSGHARWLTLAGSAPLAAASEANAFPPAPCGGSRLVGAGRRAPMLLRPWRHGEARRARLKATPSRT